MAAAGATNDCEPAAADVNRLRKSHRDIGVVGHIARPIGGVGSAYTGGEIDAEGGVAGQGCAHREVRTVVVGVGSAVWRCEEPRVVLVRVTVGPVPSKQLAADP